MMIYAQPPTNCRLPASLEREQDVFGLPPFNYIFLLCALFLQEVQHQMTCRKGT